MIEAYKNGKKADSTPGRVSPQGDGDNQSVMTRQVGKQQSE